MIKEEAARLGFYQCGISEAEYLAADAERAEKWLEQGMHGEMSWMERNRQKRYDPRLLLENCRSVISVIYNYTPAEDLPADENYKISRYAYGADYHKVVKDKLYLLMKYIEEKTGKRKARIFVDSAPVLDRAWARRAGLGFIGKNTMLINRKGGSYFFIGHILTDLELQYESESEEKNFCGSCTKCIHACPTDALKPFELDANKCISYLTIEHRSEIPEEFRESFQDWIFGCDICQEVCPWNREVQPHTEQQFEISDQLRMMTKQDWHNLDQHKYEELFHHSAVRRTGIQGLKRNIRYVE
jgi:epoxyqueuosine reductase